MQKEGIIKLRQKYRSVTVGNKEKQSREKAISMKELYNKIEKPLTNMTNGWGKEKSQSTLEQERRHYKYTRDFMHKRIPCTTLYQLTSKSRKNASFSRVIN